MFIQIWAELTQVVLSTGRQEKSASTKKKKKKLKLLYCLWSVQEIPAGNRHSQF